MNNIYHRRWLVFAKGGKMKYIGHLDLLKIFQAAIRRAGLPIAYSQGFNPHQRLSFALPLPVGMDSLCEYLELLLEMPMAEEEILEKLSAQMPEGLASLAVYAASENAPRPAAAVTAADYRLIFPGIGSAKPHLDALLEEKEIMVQKKTKGGIKLTDIRPDILALAYEPAGAVKMRLSAGSARNLSPYLAAETLAGRMGINLTPHQIKLVRLELYGAFEGQPIPLHQCAFSGKL